MGTDFYPRLAEVNQDNKKCRAVMNQQGEVGFLLLGPLMVLCVVFMPLFVRILYSNAFLAINDYVIWCTVGVIFQMASWAISYVFIAKAESKIFAINEFVVGIYGLGFNLFGYYMGGLAGLGISFVVKYVFYLLQVYFIARKRYDFSFTKSFIQLFITQLVIVMTGVIIVLFLPSVWRFVCGTITALIAIAYSLFELNRRMDLINFINIKLYKNAK